jgi:hypothetical protein
MVLSLNCSAYASSSERGSKKRPPIAFRYMRFGYASAEAFVLFLVILVVTLVQFKGQRKWVTFME